MLAIPFVFVAIGILIGVRLKGKRILAISDATVNIALVALIVVIGLKIGSNETLIKGLASIGFHCFVIAFLAILGSVLCVLFLEKTVLPLKELRDKLRSQKVTVPGLPLEREQNGPALLVYIIPISMIAGIAAGFFVLPGFLVPHLDRILSLSLVFMYTGVGISFGQNRWVLKYIKILSYKILFLSLAIMVGSIVGGLLAGLVLRIPLLTSVCAASGMSYYSMSGAIMTQALGIEAGTYGFLVNVTREFLTVLALPALIRVSPGAPIASAAAGGMDTMLLPVTEFVGVELGTVAFITGTVLTVVVPVLLTAMVRL